MLTLKLINEETERVVRGLEKKHFPQAKEAIDNVLVIDKRRRETQQDLDKCLNEQKILSGQIGKLMKEGKRDEAEQTKKTVASLKEQSKQLEEQMAKAQEEMTTLLCQIPNIPYDEVPEGSTAEDNHVVKSNLKECDGNDTVGNWNVNPSLNIMNPLPHWELESPAPLGTCQEIQPHRLRSGCEDHWCWFSCLYRQGCPVTESID